VWHVRGRIEEHKGFWWGKLKERTEGKIRPRTGHEGPEGE